MGALVGCLVSPGKVGDHVGALMVGLLVGCLVSPKLVGEKVGALVVGAYQRGAE